MHDIRPTLLMCRPDDFEPAKPHPVYGYANKFEEAGRIKFEKDPAGFHRQAAAEWLSLYDIFEKHADVTVLPSSPGMNDKVFTADASFSLDNVTILSSFTNAQKAG